MSNDSVIVYRSIFEKQQDEALHALIEEIPANVEEYRIAFLTMLGAVIIAIILARFIERRKKLAKKINKYRRNI